MKKKLLIFDMDGTILDTLEDLKDSVNYILRQYSMPERTLEEVRSFVGNGILKLVERSAVAGTKQDTILQMFDDMKQYYQLHCYDTTKPYEGIVELMNSMKEQGYLLSVVSNKADAAVQELCDRFFAGVFDAAIGERDGVARKPAPDMVHLVLQELKVAPEDAVYIGDSEVDYATAVNAELDSIIVTWGFRDEAFLKQQGATVFAHEPEEISRILSE